MNELQWELAHCSQHVGRVNYTGLKKQMVVDLADCLEIMATGKYGKKVKQVLTDSKKPDAWLQLAWMVLSQLDEGDIPPMYMLLHSWGNLIQEIELTTVTQLIYKFTQKEKKMLRYPHEYRKGLRDRYNVVIEPWGFAELSKIGQWIASCFNEAFKDSGLFVSEFANDYAIGISALRQTPYAWVIRKSDKLKEWEKEYLKKNWLVGIKMPVCIEAPKSWLTGSPYVCDLLKPQTIISKGVVRHKSQVSVASLDVLDKLGQVGYKVNKEMVSRVYDATGQGLLDKLLEKPAPLRATSDKKLTFVDYKIHRKLSQDFKDRVRMFKSTRELLSYDEMYFPHHFDYRGRMYPLTGANFQTNKLIRACLDFKDTKLIKSENLKYLKRYTADCWGVKGTFKELEAWYDGNLKLITKVRDGGNQWIDAKEPWLFLRCCLEKGNRKTGLVIPLDGVNNGFQHLAALTESKSLGKLVGLYDSSDKPDIYTVILDSVMNELTEDNFWYDKINRELIKKVLMPLPMGGHAISMKTPLHDFTMNVTGIVNTQLVSDIFSRLMIVFNQVVPNYKELMKSVKGTMKVNTVAGFTYEFVDKARGKDGSRSLSLFGNTFSVVSFREGISDTQKMNLSLPNRVHIQDGCHAQLVTEAFCKPGYKTQGVSRNLRCIHDEFGAHANDIPELAKVIREQFVVMYPKATSVLTSRYFFS